MAYGMNTAKPKCSLGDKHKWEFVRNGAVSSGGNGFGGGVLRVSLRGLYKCACGETRVGAAKRGAPGDDLRDHLPALTASPHNQ